MSYLHIDAAGRIVLNQKLLEDWRCCAHSLDSDATKCGLLVAQGILSNGPHPIQDIVGQVLVGHVRGVGESLYIKKQQRSGEIDSQMMDCAWHGLPLRLRGCKQE